MLPLPPLPIHPLGNKKGQTQHRHRERYRVKKRVPSLFITTLHCYWEKKKIEENTHRTLFSRIAVFSAALHTHTHTWTDDTYTYTYTHTHTHTHTHTYTHTHKRLQQNYVSQEINIPGCTINSGLPFLDTLFRQHAHKTSLFMLLKRSLGEKVRSARTRCPYHRGNGMKSTKLPRVHNSFLVPLLPSRLAGKIPMNEIWKCIRILIYSVGGKNRDGVFWVVWNEWREGEFEEKWRVKNNRFFHICLLWMLKVRESECVRTCTAEGILTGWSLDAGDQTGHVAPSVGETPNLNNIEMPNAELQCVYECIIIIVLFLTSIWWPMNQDKPFKQMKTL